MPSVVLSLASAASWLLRPVPWSLQRRDNGLVALEPFLDHGHRVEAGAIFVLERGLGADRSQGLAVQLAHSYCR